MSGDSVTITVVMTDIEGSTRLWERFPSEMGAALAVHDQVLTEAVTGHGGAVVKGTGDGFMATFTDAGAALECCLNAQRRLAETEWGEVGALRVRMGIHLGSAQPRAGDYYGSSVNRAARLMGLANGGQILLSASATEVARDVLPEGAELIDLGEHRLRDLTRPEHVYQLSAPGLATDFPPLQSLATYRTNLPSHLSSFVGREKALERLRQLAGEHRLLSLIGVGGTGKTRLMLQLAAELLDEYPDGVWMADLSVVSESDLVASAVSRAVQAAEEPGRPPETTLVDYLRAKSVLLLIDNCEHLIEAAASLIDLLLRSAPSVSVIATSREALGIEGEALYQVGSLTLPPRHGDLDSHLDPAEGWLEKVAGSESVELFVARAAATRPGFDLSPSNAEVVVEICHRLDGIPLALELAATRVNVLSVEEIARGLDDRFRLLSGGRRVAVPRQQTLQALIDWSWDLLGTEDQRWLARLSVLVGGWDLDSAGAIAGDPEPGPSPSPASLETLDALTRLVERSLVVVEHDATTRYRLLETIRQYATERLLGMGEASTMRDRHLAYFLDLACRADGKLRGPEMGLWLDRLDLEANNLRAALEWAFESAPVAAVELCVFLHLYWHSRAIGPEPLIWVARAAQAAEELSKDPSTSDDDLPLLARGLAAAAFAHATNGRAAEGRRFSELAVALARRSREDVPLFEALAAMNLAVVFGADPSAHPSEEVVEMARRINDPWMVALSEASFAISDTFEGRLERAKARLELATDAAHRSGNPFAIGLTAFGRARANGGAGDIEEARRWFAQAIASFEKIGDRRFALIARSELAHALRRAGAVGEAEVLYSETLHGWRHVGNRGAIANQLESLALVAIGRHDPVPSARLLGAAQSLRQASGDPMMPHELAEYEEGLKLLAAQLDPASLDRAMDEGRQMSQEQAISYAFGVLGSTPDAPEDQSPRTRSSR